MSNQPKKLIRQHTTTPLAVGEVLRHAYSFAAGLMHCGEAIGHGVDIDEALAAKYPYQRAYLPVNRLAHDGTLWNW